MERNEFIELLNLHLEKTTQNIENQMKNFGERLDKIDKHLENQNGRIGKSEQMIWNLQLKEVEWLKDHEVIQDRWINRSINCPTKVELKDDINKVKEDLSAEINSVKTCVQSIKNENMTKKEIKKWFISGLGVLGVVLSIVLTIINIIT